MNHEGHRKRLRDSFKKGGIEPFSDHNVIELVLFYAIPRKDTNLIAHELIERFGSVSGVFDAPFEELLKVDGIGENCATLIKMFPAVGRRYLTDKYDKPEFESVEALGDYCVSLFTGETVEKAYLLCYDARNRMIKSVLIAQGSLSTVNLDKRRMMEAVVINSTVSVILTHNHPNGAAAPSSADVRSTREISNLMREVSVNFADHIIVADKEYFSMRSHVNFIDMFY